VPRALDTGGSGADSQSGSTLRNRLSRFLLKPPKPTAKPAPVAPPRSVEELEDANRFADDKERLIGLVAAPVAAAIGFLVIDADISNDPVQFLKNGALNPKYTPVSTYHELLFVLLGLTVLILATAWFRKRLFLGCAMALYGLAVFNLHWWGFGVPFVLFGAWLLVRAYRAQRDLREATGTGSRYANRASSATRVVAPEPSKRYTPPATRRRRSGAGETKAG
jgi:hypothetical protein